MDAYLSRVKGERRATLQALRRTIRSIVPRAEECISYGIPAFSLDGRIIGSHRFRARLIRSAASASSSSSW